MKVTQEKDVTKKEYVTIDTLCDICGHSIEDKKHWPNYKGNQDHDSNEVIIEHRIYDYDGYGGYDYRILAFDCCPACFEEMILPYLRSIGLKKDYNTEGY